MSPTEHLIIKSGVRNLKEFGYPNCNQDNIFTDYVYATIFKGMLEDNLGEGQDKYITRLLKRIEESQAKGGES